MADLVTIEQVRAALNLGSDTSHDVELELYIDAVTEHVAERFGELPSGTYTEDLRVTDGRFIPSHYPVLSVTSATDDADTPTSYTADFTVSPDGYYVTHDDISGSSRSWTVVYTAGFAAVPADLKLAALEDIRGLYQPGQFGSSGGLGGFGIQSDSEPMFRPVRQWPRVDAWIDSRRVPVVA